MLGISLTRVNQLIAEANEGQRLEYKQELAIDRERDRIELAKDVSGMANSQGGLIIYGVAEDNSAEPLPVAVTSRAKGSKRSLRTFSIARCIRDSTPSASR